MMYLDANFFVFALLDTGPKGRKASEIQERLTRGEAAAITSVLALDELMWVLLKNKKKELLRTAIEGVYATPNLTVREVNADVPLVALELMETYGLTPRDAFHVALMKLLGIKAIVSDDRDFDKIKWVQRIKL